MKNIKCKKKYLQRFIDLCLTMKVVNFIKKQGEIIIINIGRRKKHKKRPLLKDNQRPEDLKHIWE